MRCLFPLGLPCHTSGACLVQWQLSFGLAVIHQNTSKPFKGNGPKALQQGSSTERLLFSMFLKYRFYIHFPVSLLLSGAVFLFGNSFNIPANLSFPNAHVQHEIFSVPLVQNLIQYELNLMFTVGVTEISFRFRDAMNTTALYRKIILLL